MIRKLAEFYLWAMALSFLITLFVGASGAPTTQVFLFAMLAWPLSGLVIVAKRSVGQIRLSAGTGQGV